MCVQGQAGQMGKEENWCCNPSMQLQVEVDEDLEFHCMYFFDLKVPFPSVKTNQTDTFTQQAQHVDD